MNNKLTHSNQKLEGIEEDRSGSRGTDQSVVFKKKKKRNKYYLSESNFS